MLRQVEEKNFCAFAGGEVERARIGLQSVAGSDTLAIHRNGAARHMDVRFATGLQFSASVLGAVEEPGVDASILVDAHRAIGAVGGGDEAELAALLGDGKLLL